MLTMDHILPKSKGGKTTPDNLQLLCSRCNKIKKNLVISLEDLRKKVVSKENSNAEGQSQS
jgi:5-methylcytosine-specific restriction endonuclease McrA